jgi:hypothetical protein
MLCSAAHGMNARQRHRRYEHVSSACAFANGSNVREVTATCFEQLPSVHGRRLLLRAAVQRLWAGRRSPWAVIVIAVVIITASITHSTREHTFKDLSDSRRLLNVMQCRAMLAHEVCVEQGPRP